MQGPGQQLSGWHGRGFEGLGREMAWPDGAGREREAADSVRTDGRTDTLLPRLRARAVREDELGWAAEKQRGE